MYQIINKSKAFNKLIKLNMSIESTKSLTFVLSVVVLTMLSGCGSPGGTKNGIDAFAELERDVTALINSSVADSAPLEIKFIKEKLQLAKQAKADKKRKLESQYMAQIYSDMEIARLRAELNKKNNQLLNRRDQVSAAQAFLMELKERMQ